MSCNCFSKEDFEAEGLPSFWTYIARDQDVGVSDVDGLKKIMPFKFAELSIGK